MNTTKYHVFRTFHVHTNRHGYLCFIGIRSRSCAIITYIPVVLQRTSKKYTEMKGVAYRRRYIRLYRDRSSIVWRQIRYIRCIRRYIRGRYIGEREFRLSSKSLKIHLNESTIVLFSSRLMPTNQKRVISKKGTNQKYMFASLAKIGFVLNHL